MPRYSKTHIHGYQVALLLSLVIISNAYELSYEYDTDNPWEKIIGKEDHNNPEVMDLLFGMINSDFDDDFDDDSEHLYGIPMPPNQNEQGVNILTRDLASKMKFKQDAKKIPISQLPEDVREKLYKNLMDHPETKGKFIDEFNWCAHAKIPQACESAAELIKEDSSEPSNPHAFFQTNIVRIDGDSKKAQTARRLLLAKAKSLKEEARLREEAKRNKYSENKQKQDRRKAEKPPKHQRYKR